MGEISASNEVGLVPVAVMAMPMWPVQCTRHFEVDGAVFGGICVTELEIGRGKAPTMSLS